MQKERETFNDPEIEATVKKYEKMTDEEIFEMMREYTVKLGRLPKKADIPCAFYFKVRFGPWPRFLETAGVKPVSETYMRRMESRQERIKKKHRKRKKADASQD